ncbi:MAG: DegT/DnrJ/EryC1/StrS family aminotransferase [Gammaproteobacteria bacterium]|nr:DegT/DnrJ/EryC1/StrS family aminotransferase [Gammaproteobacteria bacterium]
MNWRRLAPAGDRVVYRPGAGSAVCGLFAPWHATLLGSGTQALGATLLALKRDAPGRDEVIFAAYNCPALVSATVYAGCRPILIDYVPERPWMDLSQLAARLSTRTLAVVAVDFLGIPERHGELRALCRAARCTLVQDAAQAFPSRAGERVWQGDVVVLSFGRGKPVSLLAGGAVLARDRALGKAVARLGEQRPFGRWQHGLRVAAYNLLRRPLLYGIPAAVPALRLGETRFVPLDGIDAMPEPLAASLPAAVEAFRRVRSPQGLYAGVLAQGPWTDLATLCRHRGEERLARYPVLAADAATAQRVRRALVHWGVSGLYGAALPEVQGVAGHLVERAAFPRAEDFAARLVTLPTHEGVTARQAVRIARALHDDNPGKELAEAEA